MLQWSFRLIHILHIFGLWKMEIIYNIKRYQNSGLNNSLEPQNCASYLSSGSSKSDLEFNFHWPANLAQAKLVERVPYNSILPWKSVVRDQYILWFLVYSWEHCVNGPFGSCICLGLKGPLYTTVISFTLRKFKLRTLFLHLLWNEFCGSYLWIIYRNFDKNMAHCQNPDTCPNNSDMF